MPEQSENPFDEPFDEEEVVIDPVARQDAEQETDELDTIMADLRASKGNSLKACVK